MIRSPLTRQPWMRCGILLNSIEMTATVIIGEGEKDEAPMLFNGEVLGKGVGWSWISL